jgi:serine/threonine protein kinase
MPVQELQDALGRFVSGAVDEDEFRAFVRTYARERPRQQPEILKWLRERVGSGRISMAVGRTIEVALTEAFVEAAAEDSDGPTRTRPGRPTSPARADAPADDATASRPFVAEPAEEGDLSVGAVLGGRFTLVEELGGGGMGRVYRARDALLVEGMDRRPFVAVKVMGEDFRRHPDSFIALQREVKRTRELIHENVIRVYELHRDGPHVFMSMELLEGRPLDALVRGDYAAGLPLAQALPIVLGVGEALAYGHRRKIVHSDLKPGNVFVCDDGRIKVLDFGIARPMLLPGDGGDSTLFDPGKRLGALTPAYAALEMFAREPPDPRDDIYALAVMTYELLAGRHPFDRKPATVAQPEKLVPARIASLSRPQWQALRRGLAFTRGERTPTVPEFLAPFRPASFLRRHRKGAIAAAAVLAVAGVVVGRPLVLDWIDDGHVRPYQPVPPPPRTDLTAAERQRADDFLYLAETSLAAASPDLRAEDFAYALSKGVNSANDSVNRVLAVDPGNARALELQRRIAGLYAAKARALVDAGNYTDASALVHDGSEVFYSRDLYRLEREICNRDSASCKPRTPP